MKTNSLEQQGKGRASELLTGKTFTKTGRFLSLLKRLKIRLREILIAETGSKGDTDITRKFTDNRTAG